jgi:endonuclease I
MTPYQHIPTLAQQRELKRWVQRHYPVSQYESNQDDAIAEAQAARLRYV